ncbi:hypothetical protein Ccrd_011095 [Cynara cardunculus var. scolymus]|uniref:Uncharacterized protein n=1 Tax=Cynara cardunculus var. scolymus TaxID=59895 RepID=A0A124SHS9_CYNCS|nr:hypothetical protein Ccrd_011095 [Cynara cardunculus var. scolymus]
METAIKKVSLMQEIEMFEDEENSDVKPSRRRIDITTYVQRRQKRKLYN